jgi:hypothetical protein
MDEYFARKFTEIAKKSAPAHNNMGCMFWNGAVSKGYGIQKLTLPDHTQIVRTAHRILYMCHIKSIDIDKKMDVSHLCHQKLCININHLHLEPHDTNMSRRECQIAGHCIARLKHNPPCIFPENPVCYFIIECYFEFTSMPRP